MPHSSPTSYFLFCFFLRIHLCLFQVLWLCAGKALKLFGVLKISCNLSLCCFTNGLVRRFIGGERCVTFDRPSPKYDQKDFVPIEVKAGSLVIVHGDLIHQILRINLQNQGMLTACMWWILMAANGLKIIGSGKKWNQSLSMYLLRT